MSVFKTDRLFGRNRLQGGPGAVELGRLRSSLYFTVQDAPGRQQVPARGLGKDVLTLEVDSGEAYYVQGSVGCARRNPPPSDGATFEGLKMGLKDATGQGLEKDHNDDGSVVQIDRQSIREILNA